MFLKATPSNGKVLYVYTPSAHNTIEKLARGHLFEGLQFYMECKSERNENKIILREFNCTRDKMDRNSRN